jgi:hypothetical protein
MSVTVFENFYVNKADTSWTSQTLTHLRRCHIPQIRPAYDRLAEFTTIAEKLIDLYPEKFGGTDLKSIRCVSITNKDRPESKKLMWEIKGVEDPIRMDCPVSYYVIVYQSDWDSLDTVHRQLLVSDALHAIPSGDDAAGKTLAPDLKGYSPMLRTFGTDFMDRSDVPDIVKTKIQWKN